MRIVFACGGTAGHINPAIAIADSIKIKQPTSEILFIGNPNRMEARLVPKAGYGFSPLVVEGFHRSFTPKSIVHNVKSVFYMLVATEKVKKVLRAFAPDVVVGTGGYVSGPVLRAAAKLGIKTLTHESNAYPGLTTKLLVKHVDRVMLALEDAKEHLPTSDKYIVTGNPVRPSILNIDRNEARKQLDIQDEICILSYGGSNGAQKINDVMAEVIAVTCENAKVHHIHSMGRFGTERFPNKLKSLGVDINRANLDIREYIDNMDECLAASDIVICRSGAMTISEIQAIGKAAILIPSPNVAENHQFYNAMALVKKDAAILIEEKDLSKETLLEAIQSLINNPERIRDLATKSKSQDAVNVADNIVKVIEQLL